MAMSNFATPVALGSQVLIGILYGTALGIYQALLWVQKKNRPLDAVLVFLHLYLLYKFHWLTQQVVCATKLYFWR